jgi:PAS domain S-box-containing protein
MNLSSEQSAEKIITLQNRLDEYEQLIDAIRAGEVDAFAINTNNQSEIFTLHSVDYTYRLLVENINEGAVNLSEEGQIVYTNTYFTELLELPYENVIGNYFYQFIHPESTETFKEFFKNGLKSKTKGEIKLIIANRTIPVYISLTSLFPTIPTVAVIITDLTEIRKKEEILRMKNAELARVNNELLAFTSMTSHDLQGPLRKIQLHLSRILDKESTTLSENSNVYLTRAKQEAKNMQQLIQDLLAYSRTTTEERKFEYTDLQQLIDDVKDDLLHEIMEKQATVEATELSTVNIIPFQFRQLMHNLIGNALKYTNPAQPPHIIIKSEIASGMALNSGKLSPEKMYCHLSVSDNGIGFEQEYSEKVFEIFYRLHTESKYTGTGIGLAIVKKIVENHGGIITANSEPNKGTTFDIYIPVTGKG